MGDIKHRFTRDNLWDISSMILEGMNWGDIKHDSRVHNLWECGREISDMALGNKFGRYPA